MVSLQGRYYSAVHKTNHVIVHGKILDVMGELAFVKEAALSGHVQYAVRMVRMSEALNWKIFTQQEAEKEREDNPEVFEELDKEEELHYE